MIHRSSYLKSLYSTFSSSADTVADSSALCSSRADNSWSFAPRMTSSFTLLLLSVSLCFFEGPSFAVSLGAAPSLGVLRRSGELLSLVLLAFGTLLVPDSLTVALIPIR